MFVLPLLSLHPTLCAIAHMLALSLFCCFALLGFRSCRRVLVSFSACSSTRRFSGQGWWFVVGGQRGLGRVLLFGFPFRLQFLSNYLLGARGFAVVVGICRQAVQKAK